MAKAPSIRKNMWDVLPWDLIGEMQLDIICAIDKNFDISNPPPIRCNVFFMKSELHIHLKLSHNKEKDMIEGYIEIMSGWTDNLKIIISCGMPPYLECTKTPQIFIYTATNRRSDIFPICNLSGLVEYMVMNGVTLENSGIEFICTLTISLRNYRPIKPECETIKSDHKLICDGLPINVHRHILMGASKFFHKRLNSQPLFNVTIIDRLDKSKRIEKEVLLRMLRFMYGDVVPENNKCSTHLLSAAREYEVNKLFQDCQEALIKKLAPDSAGELFYIGTVEKASKLTYAAAKYISKNYKAVKETHEWNLQMEAFPKFFEPIRPNPLKYFRDIVLPDARSHSTGDLLVQTSVSFLLRSPEIIPTRPLYEGSRKPIKEEDSETSEETTMTDTRLDSIDTTSTSTLLEVDSMDFDSDMEPIRRKRSSPVITRRSSDSSLSPKDPFNMSELQAALPKIKFSRESLKNRLLANESKFEESFGPSTSSLSSFSPTSSSASSSFPEHKKDDEYKYRPVSAVHKRYQFLANESKFEESFGPATSTLSSFSSTSSSPSSSFSERKTDDKHKYRPVSAVHKRYQPEKNIGFKWKFYQKDIGIDTTEDSNIGESKSSITFSSMAAAPPSPQSSSDSLASMKSLHFGQSYSFSTSSMFNRESPKSMSSISYVQQTSDSELPSTSHGIRVFSPRAMKRIDFQIYTHPDAQTLSDVSSIPRDTSTLDPSSLDASSLDASSLDASTLDASTLDASSLDASSLDSSSSLDASILDPSSLDPSSLDPLSLDPLSLDPLSLDPLSLDTDSNSSLDPSSFDTDSNSSPKTKSRKGKRMKKVAEKTRKFLPGAEPANFLELSTSDEPSFMDENYPRIKSPRRKHPSQSRFHQKKGTLQESKIIEENSETTLTENLPQRPYRSYLNRPQKPHKKVSFNESLKLLSFIDEEFDEPELEDMKHYESWLDTAAHSSMQHVFEEASDTQDIECTGFPEKICEEKDEEESTSPIEHLEQAILEAETRFSAEKRHHLLDQLRHLAPSTSSSSSMEHQKIEKSLPSEITGSSSAQIPLGGGVIKKAPGRHKVSSIDLTRPFSSNLSILNEFRSSTPSSSSRSIEHKQFKRSDSYGTKVKSVTVVESSESSNLVRSQSFGDLRAFVLGMQSKTTTLAGVSSMEVQGDVSQQYIESSQRTEEDSKQKIEKIEDTSSSAIDIEHLMEKVDPDHSDDKDKDEKEK